jgi:hypothetical protein
MAKEGDDAVAAELADQEFKTSPGAVVHYEGR